LPDLRQFREWIAHEIPPSEREAYRWPDLLLYPGAADGLRRNAADVNRNAEGDQRTGERDDGARALLGRNRRARRAEIDEGDGRGHGRPNDYDDGAADDAKDRARAEREDRGGKEDADDAVAKGVDDVAERAEACDPGLKLAEPGQPRSFIQETQRSRLACI